MSGHAFEGFASVGLEEMELVVGTCARRDLFHLLFCWYWCYFRGGGGGELGGEESFPFPRRFDVEGVVLRGGGGGGGGRVEDDGVDCDEGVFEDWGIVGEGSGDGTFDKVEVEVGSEGKRGGRKGRVSGGRSREGTRSRA